MDKIQILKKIESFLETQPDHTFVFNEGTTLDLVFWGKCTTTYVYIVYIKNEEILMDFLIFSYRQVLCRDIF